MVIFLRFPVYVDPALVDSPMIVATSLGRSFAAKLTRNKIRFNARRFLQVAPIEVEAKLLSSRLQFPELRLIEYDCGGYFCKRIFCF